MILMYLCITRPFPYFRFRRSSPVSFADTLPPGEGICANRSIYGHLRADVVIGPYALSAKAVFGSYTVSVAFDKLIW